MTKYSPRHIIRAQQFDQNFLNLLFKRTDELAKLLDDPAALAKLQQKGHGRQIFTLFYEPSTRTRMSFEAAANNLGLGIVTTENAAEFSSAAKGETLEDTIQVLNGYHPAAIVMRHFDDGASERAAKVSRVPIISAGDGRAQHPTQALLDLYTIHRELGRTTKLTVVAGGDLANGRTIRSLMYLLAKADGSRFIFVSPPQLKMGDDIKAFLDERQLKWSETTDLNSVLSEADLVYWTRIQKERLRGVDYESVAHQYQLDKNHLKLMKKKSIIMHPLPRIDEIATEVDADPRAAYFRQAGYGLIIRMALLEWVIGL